VKSYGDLVAARKKFLHEAPMGLASRKKDFLHEALCDLGDY